MYFRRNRESQHFIFIFQRGRNQTEEMIPTAVDKVLMEIATLSKDPHLTFQMTDQIQTLQLELAFLKLFIWVLPGKSLRKSYIRATVGNKLCVYGTHGHAGILAASKLLQRVELCKKKIGEDCPRLFDSSSQCKFSNTFELIQFMNCTLRNLRSLVRLKPGGIVPVRMQVRALIKKLRMFRDFVKYSEEGFYSSFHIQDWACKIACLSTMYWVDQMGEAMAPRMKAFLTDLLHMVESYSPEVIGLYNRVLRASKLFDSFEIGAAEIGEVVVSFVDFILPIGFMRILREGLMFLITFAMDPHPTEWSLVLTKAKAVVSEIPAIICSLTIGEMDQEIAKERNVLLGDFQKKVDEVKAEAMKLLYAPESWGSHSPVREVYFRIWSYFPTTNALGFIDFLLENMGNLKETLISQPNFLPFARNGLLTLQKELVSLRPSFKNIQDLQNEFEELKDLWMQITDTSYHAEHVIDSCQIFDVPIWYKVVCLSSVIEEIKFIKWQTEKILDNQMYTNRILSAKVNSGRIHLRQSYSSTLNEVIVGLEDEAERIINRLTRGSRKLEIVSIVGMPGQGKTTLAKKVYNSPSIRYHFNKCAWCFVTEVYEDKMLLLDILRDVTTVLDDEICNMSKEDLAQKLYKCLKGERYLIIMDDIWDITAWNAFKGSFPDDENGSGILFTSRNKFGCNPHLLRPLSYEESMELLQQKLLCQNILPSNFSDDVEEILKVCNGLPLAIVVVAGLLNRVSDDLYQWMQIVKNLNPKLTSEGCMDILELSYKNLPDFLKPCFLYLCAVGQTKVFKVHKIVQLWIAEGFVRKSGIQSLEEVAREYLEDLIGRSLVIVNKRSFSSGEIKECRIHDLFLELCLTKAKEERFIHFPNAPNNSREPIFYDQYRLCISNRWEICSWSKPTGPNVRSLLFPSCNHGLQYPYLPTSSLFIGLKFLRVLDMENVDFDDRFPEEIQVLICLRYLSIKCKIKYVPLSIGNLCNLETFHVIRERRSILQFPHTIWKMKALRNVDIGGTAIILLEDHDGDVCPQLGNLDSFSSLYLRNVEDAEKILRGFPRIRKLRLEFSLSWDCRRNCGQFQVLHFLRRLESLNLQYRRYVAHSCTFNFPTALKKLTLSQFNRTWSEISTIGKLPNLEVLKLLNSVIIGERWEVEDEEFLNLRYLKLSGLSISHWEASAFSFPCLERLVVRHCCYLQELPSIFGDVMTLKMIEVHGCLKCLGTSAESILNEQRDMGKEDLEVLISGVLEDYRRRFLPFLHLIDGPWSYAKSMLKSEMPDKWTFLKFRHQPFPKDLFSGFHDINRSIWDKKVAFGAPYMFRGPLELDRKGVMERSVARVKKGHVPSARRTKPVLRNNCQPRQAIVSRHTREELKRSG